MGNYDDSALESMKAIARDTIKVGYETPFNTIRIYQKYATALIKGSTLPPMTLVRTEFATGLLRRFGDINRRVCLLIYFLPGGNPRTTELGDQKLINGHHPRTVFRDIDGEIWATIQRTKTQTCTRLKEFIPTKCPPRLSRIIEKVQLLLRPFKARLVHHLYGEEVSLLTKQFFWLYVEICRISVRSELETFLEGDDVAEDDVGILQQLHSAPAPDSYYALEHGQLPHTTSQRMHQFGRMSYLYWGVWGGVEGKPAQQPIQTKMNLLQDTSATISDSVETHGILSEANIINIVSAMIAQQQSQWTEEFKRDVQTMLLLTLINNLNSSTKGSMVQDFVMEAPATSLQHRETSSLNICRYEQLSSLNIRHFEQPSSSNNNPHKQLASSDIILQEQSSFTIPPHSRPPLRDVPSEQRQPITEAQSAPRLTHESYSQHSLHQFNILDPKDPLHTVQPLDDIKVQDLLHPLQACSDELLYTLLKKHFPSNPNPRFKSSEQKLLCKMAIERSENVVAIMSTGSGKSLSWLLPARLEDRMMMVVIVP
ncbi:hypothetical protein M422DRAFT_256246 [Sphaerobolus stellatus SS14]|uniref:DNA helicase n=1 Tax=Sphaerobolus stellatus (strain SS14) TaxID=990650 RepID=A0A0C9UCJ0_SPHS4|nr:hypothetical protein M422DRAFT_256246 [Sphaerobolus stellatus SS14]